MQYLLQKGSAEVSNVRSISRPFGCGGDDDGDDNSADGDGDSYLDNVNGDDEENDNFNHYEDNYKVNNTDANIFQEEDNGSCDCDGDKVNDDDAIVIISVISIDLIIDLSEVSDEVNRYENNHRVNIDDGNIFERKRAMITERTKDMMIGIMLQLVGVLIQPSEEVEVWAKSDVANRHIKKVTTLTMILT